MDIEGVSREGQIPIQKKSNLDMGEKLTPLQKQQFQSKLTTKDLGQLKDEMKAMFNNKAVALNLKEALKKTMRTVFDANIETTPMAERRDIGMAELMKAFVKMDKSYEISSSMETGRIEETVQKLVTIFREYKGNLGFKPSERKPNEFKRILYNQYKASLNEPTGHIFNIINKVYIDDNSNYNLDEPEYFFFKFQG